MTDEEKRQEGFHAAPRSWSEVQSAMVVAAMFVAALAWGLKMDADIKECSLRLSRLEAESRLALDAVNKGILPVTEKRLDLLTERVVDMRKALDRVQDAMDNPKARKP